MMFLCVYTTPMLQGLVNDVSLHVHYSYVTGPGE